MAYRDPMVTGVMLTPLKGYECASSYSRGKTSKDGDGVEKYAQELKFDLDLPLREVLDSVFSNYGHVIIDFPRASYEQVSSNHDQQCTQ